MKALIIFIAYGLFLIAAAEIAMRHGWHPGTQKENYVEQR